MLPNVSQPVVVEILGERWQLPDPALRDRWARCISAGEGVSARRVEETTSPYGWTSEATVLSIEARAGEWLMFHAAGLCRRDGSVAALVGPSGTGKSTAARVLCQTDFGYVTDETVALRRDGRVVPFPKPIAVVASDGGVKLELGPDELGLLPCLEHLNLEALVRLERDEGYSAPQIEMLGLLDGMIAIVSEMSALPKLTAPLAWLAETVEKCGGVHKIGYRDADHLADPIRAALESPPISFGYRHHPGRDRSGRPAPGMVARAGFIDAIELASEILILQGSVCSLLSGIGGLVWLATDVPITVEQLTAELVRVIGEHPNAQGLVEEAVEDLEDLGVLVRGWDSQGAA